MKVIAIAPGFLGCRRRKGDVFDVPDGTRSKWFEAAPAVKPPAPVEKPTKAKGGKRLAPDGSGATDLV